MLIRAILVIVGLTALVWGAHRLFIRLEDAGYMYYREKKGGGGSGVSAAFSELDKLTRPSIEHVVEVEDQTKIVRDDHRGE